MTGTIHVSSFRCVGHPDRVSPLQSFSRVYRALNPPGWQVARALEACIPPIRCAGAEIGRPKVRWHGSGRAPGTAIAWRGCMFDCSTLISGLASVRGGRCGARCRRTDRAVSRPRLERIAFDRNRDAVPIKRVINPLELHGGANHQIHAVGESRVSDSDRPRSGLAGTVIWEIPAQPPRSHGRAKFLSERLLQIIISLANSAT